MEMRHLRYFVAVAEELSFHRAANRLHVTQPSLGRQVRHLEAEIGERLFERDRQHVALTDAGRMFLDKARELLAGAEAAIRSAREASHGLQGSLHIGNIGILSASFLPDSLAAFRKQYPRVGIEVLELLLDEQAAALLAGTIQVGFQPRIDGAAADPRFSTRPVFTSGVSVALPAGHPLAARKALSLQALQGERLLNLQQTRQVSYERWLRAFCEQRGGFVPRLRQPAVDHANALLGLVAANEGVVILPAPILQNFPPSKHWVALPLRSSAGRFLLEAVWNPANPSRVLSNYLSLLPRPSSPPGTGPVSPEQRGEPTRA